MGRAIVLVFFIVGFFIFLVVKHAVFGVKAAYKAVNDPEGFRRDFVQTKPLNIERRTDTATEIISSLLSMQLAFTSQDIYSITKSSVAADDYSIGYVFGFVDGFIQASSLKNDDIVAMAGIATVVFVNIFGEELGPSLFGRSLDLQRKDNPLFASGRALGGQEAIGFATHGSKKSPMGWSRYLFAQK